MGAVGRRLLRGTLRSAFNLHLPVRERQFQRSQGDTQAGLAMGLLEWYDHLMVDLRDPRVDNWLGMTSIWPTIIICTAYVYFILFMAFYRQAYSAEKSVVKVDKNGNSDSLNNGQTGNGQLANGHNTVLPNGGGTDLRQRKLA